MTESITVPPVQNPSNNSPGKTRTGSFQSRRKMITMWIFLVLGWVIVFGHMTSAPSAPESRSTPPVAAQAPAPVILPPTASLAPLPAPLPTLPPVDQPVPSAGPLTTFADGTYEVGVDIKPGKYKGKVVDGDMGYWARRKDSNGTLESIIANKIVKGQDTVTIAKTDALFETNGIQWTLVKK